MTERARPLVSVIIPARNAESTLRQTLRSVVDQTYSQLEIIVVDDGSTDRTAAIAEEFCAADSRARLLRKPNGGVASARNLGIEQSRGEWLAPIDSDDLWHPRKIEKQMAVALGAAAPPGFVYCWYHYLDAEGRVIGSGPEWAIEGSVLNRLAALNFVQNGSALLLRREAVLAVGGYEPALRAHGGQGCEDILIELQIAARYAVCVVPEHLVGYRCLPESMSRDSAQMARSWGLVWRTLARDGVAVPAAAIRWTRAQTCVDLAQEAIMRGKVAQSVKFAALAVWFDPIRSGAYLLYRLVRLGTRLLRGRRPEPERLSFENTPPGTRMSGDPDALPALWSILERIEERRNKRIARLDRSP